MKREIKFRGKEKNKLVIKNLKTLSHSQSWQ